MRGTCRLVRSSARGPFDARHARASSAWHASIAEDYLFSSYPRGMPRTITASRRRAYSRLRTVTSPSMRPSIASGAVEAMARGRAAARIVRCSARFQPPLDPRSRLTVSRQNELLSAPRD